MSNYMKKFIVMPGSKVRLKHFDPGYHGKHESTEKLCRRFRSTSRKWSNCSI